MVKQTQIILNRKILIGLYIFALFFGFIAILFPSFAFRFVGLVIMLLAAGLIFWFVTRMYQQFRYQGYIPKPWFLQTGMLSLIIFLLILIPASSLQSVIGFLLILSLIVLGVFQLYIAEKKILRKQARKNYFYGVSSLVLAVVVFFNLTQSSEIFMRMIGVVTVYYALMQLYIAIKTKLI
jgi:uncharacterized membrane protein HdeD (DUF308 family)